MAISNSSQNESAFVLRQRDRFETVLFFSRDVASGWLRGGFGAWDGGFGVASG